MGFLYGDGDEHGVAGDTGSAVHKAAFAMHRGASIADSLQIMGDCIAEYPRADLKDAAQLFFLYSADTRNTSAKVVLCEQAIAFSIMAAPEDPTGEPIQVVGRLDQVREEHGHCYLYDIKTSKKDPHDILHATLFQAAAYCVGATIALGKTVYPGGIITPRRYRASDPSNSPVHHRFGWKWEDVEQVLSGLRHVVAMIRSGHVWHRPNEGCTWCAARSPDACLPKLQQELRLRA